MSQSTKTKKPSRERKRITRTACEPCREKRAKCDGQKPCERCQTRGLDCQFVQRAWASKRSLQDESALLRVQLLRRDRVLDALAEPGSGDEVLKMLRTKSLSADDIYDVMEKRNDQNRRSSRQSCQNEPDQRDCDSFCSPSTVDTTTVSAGSQNCSPYSLSGSLEEQSHTPLSQRLDQHMPQPPSPPLPQQSQHLGPPLGMQQQMMWKSSATTMDGLNMMGNSVLDTSLDTGISMSLEESPQVIDPLLWPSNTASAPLGEPWMNSWTGLCSHGSHSQNEGLNTTLATPNMLLNCRLQGQA